jgi:hypothetical protein
MVAVLILLLTKSKLETLSIREGSKSTKLFTTLEEKLTAAQPSYVLTVDPKKFFLLKLRQKFVKLSQCLILKKFSNITHANS